jgi:outer membrane protein OmpA-like peptidoglycan-associated protein
MYKYLVFLISVFLITACSGIKTVKGVSVEVFKEQRQKPTPAQTIIARPEILLTPAYFEFDKHELSRDSKNILTTNISAMKNARQIIAVGSSDSRGTEKHNKTLAQKRAYALTDFYVLRGINPDLIEISVNLKEQNICTDKNDEPCHSKNRMADTVVKFF